MRSTAFLLCGDWHRAEDLVQTAFTKLYLAWDRVARRDVLDQYTRKVLLRVFLDETRRGWWRRERVAADPPDGAVAAVTPENRLMVLRALAALPPRQRAVVVLRYWEDLSIEDTAALLDCSTGNVTSQASRGLATLRGLMETPAYAVPEVKERT